VANEQNLIPFTSDQDREEAKKNGKKGGVASGLARREKATMKKVLMDMLDEIGDKENNLTYRQLTTLGLLKGAIQGNATNYKTILEAIGEIETTGSTPEVVIKVVDNTDLEKVMYEKED
jgi:hypothetical protein